MQQQLRPERISMQTTWHICGGQACIIAINGETYFSYLFSARSDLFCIMVLKTPSADLLAHLVPELWQLVGPGVYALAPLLR